MGDSSGQRPGGGAGESRHSVTFVVRLWPHALSHVTLFASSQCLSPGCIPHGTGTPGTACMAQTVTCTNMRELGLFVHREKQESVTFVCSRVSGVER